VSGDNLKEFRKLLSMPLIDAKDNGLRGSRCLRQFLAGGKAVKFEPAILRGTIHRHYKKEATIMTMTLSVPDDIAAVAQQPAKCSGLTAEQLLLDDFRARFPPFPAELRAESDALDSVSDKGFVRYSQ